MATNNADQCGAVVVAEIVKSVTHVIIAIFNFDFFDYQCAVYNFFVIWFEHEMTVRDKCLPFAIVYFYSN